VGASLCAAAAWILEVLSQPGSVNLLASRADVAGDVPETLAQFRSFLILLLRIGINMDALAAFLRPYPTLPSTQGHPPPGC
jgi:hypothetical protein